MSAVTVQNALAAARSHDKLTGSLLAVLGGASLGLAYQPYALWPLAILAVALLTLLARHAGTRRSLWLGLLFGLAQGAVAITWVAVLGWWVAVLLVIAMSVWPMAVAWAIARTAKLPASWLFASAAWTAAEFGTANVPFGGFPWLRLVWTTVDQPMSGWLPVIGAVGTSWLVAASGQAAAALAAPRKSGRRARRFARGSAVLVLVVAFTGGALLAARPIPPGGPDITLGVVQGDVNGTAGPHAMGYARSVTNNHVSETVTLMARARTGLDPTPNLVLWPENSTDIDPTKDAQTALLVRLAEKVAQLPIMVGAVMSGPGPDERQTSTLWWTTDNTIAARYNKRNLVPFGEYIPLRSLLLPILPILREVGAQSVPGHKPGVLTGPLANGQKLTVGTVICYELAWDTTVAQAAGNGAQVLVVQSNNGTYTDTGQPPQQFAITRGRAMELQREIVVATTNALSGLIDARGRVIERSQEGTAWARSITVPERTGVTIGAQLDPWLDWASLAVALVGLVWSFVPGVRRRLGR